MSMGILGDCMVHQAKLTSHIRGNGEQTKRVERNLFYCIYSIQTSVYAERPPRVKSAPSQRV
jgi:hypothetical protein